MRKSAIVILAAAFFILSGCGSGKGQSTVSPSPSAPPPSPSVTVSAQPTASAGAGELSVSDYFPVKADVRLVYRGSGNEYAAFQTTVDFIANGAVQLRINNGGTESVTVYTVGDDAVTKVFTQGETYYRDDYTSKRVISEALIQGPLTVGTSWSLGGAAVRSITAVDADVTVPYGTFKALEVTTKDTASTITEYYAPGVGLVKRVFTSNEDPSSPVTSELEKFEDGSPLNENTRFYYPHFDNDKVAYIDKTVSFHTNDTVASIFEAELKSVQGTALSPVISPGAAINSITYDMESGVATVDLSKSFVTGMNAGTRLEGLILESLADTLGTYYQTNKIAVTVDGGPYESGHFLFNTGDLLPVNPDKAVLYQ